MSQDDDTAVGFELQHFEKNRYFQGKLMSARDMVTDQQYHASRLESLTKLSTGTGIVAGLGISEFEDQGDQIQVTIEPGLAIDSKGRPVIVRNPTTRSFAVPDGGELYLYIEYDTETKDPVPVPGNDPLSEEQSEDSRILEVFSLTTRETAPSTDDSTPAVDFPDLQAADKSLSELAHEVANAYHDTHRADIDADPDSAVFLGSFKRSAEGEWITGSETDRRPLVYDNEMLFAMLLSHIADTDNPHHTRVGEPTEYMESELDRMDELSLRLDQMRSDVSEMSDQLELHTDYTTRKSLKTTIRFFDDLADSFEHQSEISRLSLQIVESIRNRFSEELHTDQETYVEFVRELVPDLQSVAEELDGQVTPRSHDQFCEAVDGLSAALEEDPTLIAVATGLDSIGEAAEMLEKQARVVADED